MNAFKNRLTLYKRCIVRISPIFIIKLPTSIRPDILRFIYIFILATIWAMLIYAETNSS